MATSILFLNSFTPPRTSNSPKCFFFIPTILALITSLLILIYTSNLLIYHQPTTPLQSKTPTGASTVSLSAGPRTEIPVVKSTNISFIDEVSYVAKGGSGEDESQGTLELQMNSNGDYVNRDYVFHERDIFMENYKELNNCFKIYVYPHRQDNPFANVLLPVNFEPGGNYASESYFKKVLLKSHFITNDPSEADLFFMPFSIARLRHDPRVGIDGIQDFIRDYCFNVSHNYPYWNRTGGADHFYVACHSIGRSAIKKAEEIRLNAIQVVCSSSYFQYAYVAHKDASLPQIWPRQGNPPTLVPAERKKMAFFAGSINSPVRKKLLQTWSNDTEISVHFGRLKTSYAEELLGSKFCLHVKGYEVNTARIGDALYYGCVPVIIANHYDLPFADILNWKSFSIIVATLDIPLLKKILRGISNEEYSRLQSNVLKVRSHFQWHLFPIEYDAFHMVMYELWLRRSTVRVPLSA